MTWNFPPPPESSTPVPPCNYIYIYLYMRGRRRRRRQRIVDKFPFFFSSAVYVYIAQPSVSLAQSPHYYPHPYRRGSRPPPAHRDAPRRCGRDERACSPAQMARIMDSAATTDRVIMAGIPTCSEQNHNNFYSSPHAHSTAFRALFSGTNAHCMRLTNDRPTILPPIHRFSFSLYILYRCTRIYLRESLQYIHKQCTYIIIMTCS